MEWVLKNRNDRCFWHTRTTYLTKLWGKMAPVRQKSSWTLVTVRNVDARLLQLFLGCVWWTSTHILISLVSRRRCSLGLSGINAGKAEFHFKLSFLVELCSWNAPRIANVLLWQAGFRGWQTALFSFRVLLSALIEIFCHGLQADGKQGCWPPCMRLSLSTLTQAGPRAASKRIRGVEKER